MKTILIIISTLFILSSCGNNSSKPVVGNENPTSDKSIIALGDSLTIGYGLKNEDSYPSQLQSKLKEKGYNYRIINAGVSGDTTAGLLDRIDWVLDAPPPTEKGDGGGYALIILCIGANDAFQGKSVDEIESNLRKIIEKIQAKNISILFAGMKAPLNLGGEYGRKYEAIFPKLAQEYKLPFMEFFLKGVALKANLNQDDRIHPTKDGYTLVVNNLMEVLEEENLITKD